MTRALCVAVVVAALFETAALPANAGAGQSIVVTRSGQLLPGGCTAAEIAALTRRLFDAFNAGDWDVVDESFALFSLEPDVVIYDRGRLVPYLAKVRARGERFRLVALKASTGHHSMIALVFAFERAEGIAGGKGMFDCISGRIWQGALGPPQPGTPSVPCPRPPGWSPSGPILACTGGPNARAVSADLKVHTSSGRLPRQCSPSCAFGKLRSALSGFNGGHAEAFAKHFVTPAFFIRTHELSRASRAEPGSRVLPRRDTLAATDGLPPRCTLQIGWPRTLVEWPSTELSFS